MTILNLNHWGVKEALRHDALKGLPKLGRGWFCVVFDNGDTVLKLTADRIQHGFYTDYTAPQGDRYPRLIRDYGEVGYQNDHCLYLVEMEKLTKFGRKSEVGDKAWKERRDLLTVMSELEYRLCGQFYHIKSMPDFHRYLSEAVLGAMSADDRLSKEMQECCGDLRTFVSNYGCAMDFHRGNFMLRGSKLIFNDVVTDIESICSHNSRRQCHNH